MANTYLTRTPASAGNRKTWTWSAWIKISKITIDMGLLFGAQGQTAIYINNGSSSVFRVNGVGSGDTEILAVFRDPSAWYHFVVSVDTTQATSSNRLKIYINGVQNTSYLSNTEPTLNGDSFVNSTALHTIGKRSWSADQDYDGLMAHVHFIDGTAYDASTFGETDATTGIWKPKTAPVVTYGTNGFFLKFENSASFGTDSSGNGNNFTVNGTMTQTIDTPSNVFATLNPLSRNAGTFANGNTSKTGGNDIASTIGVTTGKWYWEVKRSNSTNSFHTGICSTNKGMNGVSEQFLNGEANSIGGAIYVNEGNTGNTSYSGGAGFSSVTYNSFGAVSISSGDILGFALDLDSATKRLDVYQNGSSIGNVTFSYDELNPIFVYCRMNAGVTADFNFGNGYFGTTTVSSAENPDDGIGIFEFSPPTGYKSLCTKSLNSQEYD